MSALTDFIRLVTLPCDGYPGAPAGIGDDRVAYVEIGGKRMIEAVETDPGVLVLTDVDLTCDTDAGDVVLGTYTVREAADLTVERLTDYLVDLLP